MGDNASAVFHEAGHILGAAMVELIVQECDCSRRIVFSGDLGMPGKPFVRSPDQLTEADWLVLESTYGDRDHADGGSIEDQLATAINEAVDAGGKVLVPIFAVERRRSCSTIWAASSARAASPAFPPTSTAPWPPT